MRGGVRPGLGDPHDALEALARRDARQESDEAKDRELAERAQRLASLREHPAWADLQELTELLFAQYDEAAMSPTLDARERLDAIAAKRTLLDWWRRLGAADALGRQAMARIVARQFGPALTGLTMR